MIYWSSFCCSFNLLKLPGMLMINNASSCKHYIDHILGYQILSLWKHTRRNQSWGKNSKLVKNNIQAMWYNQKRRQTAVVLIEFAFISHSYSLKYRLWIELRISCTCVSRPRTALTEEFHKECLSISFFAWFSSQFYGWTDRVRE